MKVKKRKIIKILSVSTISLATVGFILSVSTVWNANPIITISGSSAMQPLVVSLSNVYSNADIVVNSGGSGAGIDNALNGIKEIGMASKTPPNYTNDPTKEQQWKDKQMKTITISWDGIALVYKPPKDEKNKINLDKETMAKVYYAFSGFEPILLSELIQNPTSEATKTTRINPCARAGGGKISGTADAFFHDSKLDYKNSAFWQNLGPQKQIEIEKALNNGSYGQFTQQTSESNSQAWNYAKNSHLNVGTMVYLSAGFVLNNLEEIKNNGFEVAWYNNYEFSKKNISNGYNWFRPFNFIVSLKNIKTDTKQFIEWLFTNKEAKKIIEQQGYINLTNKQLESMGLNLKNGLLDWNNFWLSDDAKLNYKGAQATI